MEPNQPPPTTNRLSTGQAISYSAGELAATYLPMVITSWLMFYYCPLPEEGKTVVPLMTLFAFSVVQFAGKISDSLANPLVGFLSDRAQTRWGRRIPFIIFGTPLIAVTTALIWFPPDNHPSTANNLWLLVNLVVFWAAYTFVVAPYLALMPEIARSNEERIKVGSFMAGGDVLGFVLAAVIGILASGLAGKINLGPIDHPFKLFAIFSAVFVLFMFWLTWWTIKEGAHSASKEVTLNFFAAIKETFKNPAFPFYVIAITLLNPIRDMAFGVMPYYAKYIIKLGDQAEMWTGFFQIAILAVAGLSLPLINWTANKWGKKIVFILGVGSFALIMPVMVGISFLPVDPGIHKFICLAGFALLGPGAGAMLVLWRPIIGDIIDFDEKLTGFRREAMYMGVEGLVGKLGAGLAPIFIALNFFLFNKGGGYAGVLTAMITNAALVFITCLIFVKHPFRK